MPKTTPAAAEPRNHEAAMAELERLVADMEAGSLPLEKLLTGYKRGAELLQYCREQLVAVEEQVRILEDGQLKPWLNP